MKSSRFDVHHTAGYKYTEQPVCAAEGASSHCRCSAEDEVAAKEARLQEVKQELATAKVHAEETQRRAMRMEGLVCEAQAQGAAKEETLAVLEVPSFERSS
jgi:hypothetical protein